MELKHDIATHSIFQTIAIIVAVAQALIAIGFLVAGDFGNPLAFSMSWLLPASVLMSACLSASNRNYLIACIGCNLAGILFLWGGYAFFPAWLYGNILTSYGAHTLFVCCASLVNVVPVVVCMNWRSKLVGSNAG